MRVVALARLGRRAARGERRGASKLAGVRLLWEEEALDAIGAFCVAAFALGSTWMLLEGALGLSPLLSGGVAFIVALWTLGRISRHRYPERRTFAAQHVPAEVSAATQATDSGEPSVPESVEKETRPSPVVHVGDGSWSEAVQMALELQRGEYQASAEAAGAPDEAVSAPDGAADDDRYAVRPRTAAARRTAVA